MGNGYIASQALPPRAFGCGRNLWYFLLRNVEQTCEAVRVPRISDPEPAVRENRGNCRRGRNRKADGSSVQSVWLPGLLLTGAGGDPFDEQVTLEELLERSDIVSLHCPLTAQTRGMIGGGAGADEENPFSHHCQRRRGGYPGAGSGPGTGKDCRSGLRRVRHGTAPPADYPLLHTPHTIVTPHIAFASAESMEQRRRLCLTICMPGWRENRSTQCNGRTRVLLHEIHDFAAPPFFVAPEAGFM